MTEQKNVAEATAVEQEKASDPLSGLLGDLQPKADRPKLEDRRAEAVNVAREALGENADTASVEDAVKELIAAEHPFVDVLKTSSQQRYHFGADFRRVQPKAAARTWKYAEMVKAELKSGREALTAARNGQSEEEIVTQLQELKILADIMIAKLQAEEEETEEATA